MAEALVILLGGLVLVALPCAWVAWRVSSRRTAMRRLGEVDGRECPGGPVELLQAVQVTLGNVRNVVVTPQIGGSVDVARTYYPGWVILVAIVFFPLGLLALLARTTEHATVIAAPSGHCTIVRIGGKFGLEPANALADLVERYAAGAPVAMPAPVPQVPASTNSSLPVQVPPPIPPADAAGTPEHWPR